MNSHHAADLVGRWISEGADHGEDPVCGARIRQITSQHSMATNIYGEDPYCSAACNRAVILRSQYTSLPGPVEIWVHDLSTGLSQLVEVDARSLGLAQHAYADYFCYLTHSSGGRKLVRLCLSTLEREVVHVFPEERPLPCNYGSMSPDSRYYINSAMDEDRIHHILVVHLHTGQQTTIASGEDICNSHPRSDRVDGDMVLIQRNRGQRTVADGQMETYDPEPGATLFVVSRSTGKCTDLPIASPHFPGSVSGHEAWIKGKPEIVYSSAGRTGPHKEGTRCGNLFRYRLGEAQPELIIDDPVYHGHVSTSACGRYWVNDRFAPGTLYVAVGSIETRKWANLCIVVGPPLRAEIGHAHPYMTPDASQVLFVSTRTGSPQVFAAEIPRGFLDALD